MQKGAKQLIILCGAAVILGGAYGGLTVWNNYTEKKEAEEKEAEEEAARIYLAQVEEADRLEVTNENGTFSFTYNADEETWSYDKDDKFPLKQSEVTAVTSRLESLEAVRRLEETDDLAVYGLDAPSYRVLVSRGDDTETALEIGNASEASGDYYIRLEGDDNIYTVASSFVSALDLSEDDLLEKESWPVITDSNIMSVVWEQEDRTAVWEKLEREAEPETQEETSGGEEEEETIETEADVTNEETETETETETQTAAMETYWLRKEGDTEQEADPSELLSLITGLSYTGCADYYMEESESGTYGLGETAEEGRLSVTYTSGGEEKELVLKIGGKTEDESGYYVQTEGSDMVNTVEAEAMETLMEALNAEPGQAEE